MTELHHRTAVDVAARIARGELTSRAASERMLDRIRTADPQVNAVVEVAEQELLDAADRADAEPATGPLHGLPMTVKDALDARGLHTTWGNPEWRDAVAGTDSAVVARLRAAGALVAGKTNAALMLADFGQTDNPLFGATRNPWHPDRAAGGSSGGSAAAVATGMSYLEYGSDLAGSLRIPAALCGVYGLRPTPGIVPTAGFQPPGPPAAPTPLDCLATLGPLARGAADLRAALRVTAGPLAPASAAWTWSLPPARHERLADFRVGVVLDDARCPVTGEVGAVLSDLVDALAAGGVPIVPGWPPGFDPGTSAATFGYLVGAFFAFAQGDTEAGGSLGELVAGDRRRHGLQAAWDGYFSGVDVLLCPVTFSTAPAQTDLPMSERRIATPDGDRDYQDLAYWITHASVAGLPALSAPAGLAADGLPVGVQVLGPRFEDDTVITFAELLAEIGGYRPPPG